jgi:hypothetical protein
MTQLLQFPRPVPHGWTALAHALVAAPSRRRREFALTEPVVFRSECFAEDLPPVTPPVSARRPEWRVAPLALALAAAVTGLLGHGA